jgi:hypothetical protein
MFLQIKWSGLFEPAPGSRCDVGVGSGVGGGEHGYSCKLVRQYTSHIKSYSLLFKIQNKSIKKDKLPIFLLPVSPVRFRLLAALRDLTEAQDEINGFCELEASPVLSLINSAFPDKERE